MSFLSFNKSKSKNISDEELISKYKNTLDFSFVEVLFERYTALTYGLALKYLKDIPLAKDMVLEIYASLPAKIEKHEVNNFKSWLYRVAKNHILNHLRKENRRLEKESTIKSMYFEETEHLFIEDDVLNKENMLTICLEKLKENQLLCIKLFYYEKYSYKEIVDKTGFVLGKIRSLIQNGRRNLKICIEHQHG